MDTTLAGSGSAPAATKREGARLWPLLALAGPLGFCGALPYFIPLLQQAAATARAAGKSVPPFAVVLAGQLIQVSLFALLAAWAGARLASRTGFDAPYLRARLEHRPAARRFAAELPLALLLGALFSAAILGLNALAGPHLPEAMRVQAAPALGAAATAGAFFRGASSLFYGGLFEELLLRWGVLSALAALCGLLGARGTLGFWLANVVTALLFGLGHLPAVHALGIPLDALVVAYVVLANGLAGLACGWLLRRRGLESAMVAHGFGDLCLHALPLLFTGLFAAP